MVYQHIEYYLKVFGILKNLFQQVLKRGMGQSPIVSPSPKEFI